VPHACLPPQGRSKPTSQSAIQSFDENKLKAYNNHILFKIFYWLKYIEIDNISLFPKLSEN
jgi:hypothetical protein